MVNLKTQFFNIKHYKFYILIAKDKRKLHRQSYNDTIYMEVSMEQKPFREWQYLFYFDLQSTCIGGNCTHANKAFQGCAFLLVLNVSYQYKFHYMSL